MRGKSVWKFEVPVDDQVHSIPIPAGAKIVGVRVQQPNVVALWCEVTPDRNVDAREFIVIGTGHRVPTRGTHVGVGFDGPFVRHLYEVSGDQ